MGKHDKGIESLFGRVEAFLDAAHIKAHEVAGDLVDSLFIIVDEIVADSKEAVKNMQEPQPVGEEIKVEPDLEQMIKDIANHRLLVTGVESSWSKYVNNPNIAPMSEADAAYTRTVWDCLPESAKTYVKRDPDSPL